MTELSLSSSALPGNPTPGRPPAYPLVLARLAPNPDERGRIGDTTSGVRLPLPPCFSASASIRPRRMYLRSIGTLSLSFSLSVSVSSNLCDMCGSVEMSVGAPEEEELCLWVPDASVGTEAAARARGLPASAVMVPVVTISGSNRPLCNPRSTRALTLPPLLLLLLLLLLLPLSE